MLLHFQFAYQKRTSGTTEVRFHIGIREQIILIPGFPLQWF